MGDEANKIDEELAQWGWAPGWYVGGQCSECGGILDMVAKRAFHCRPCAEKGRDAWLKRMANAV